MPWDTVLSCPGRCPHPTIVLRSQLSAWLSLASLVSSLGVPSQGHFRNTILVQSEDMSQPPELSMFNFQHHVIRFAFLTGLPWTSCLASRQILGTSSRDIHALIFLMSPSSTRQHSQPSSRTDLASLLASWIFLVLRLDWLGFQMPPGFQASWRCESSLDLCKQVSVG